MAVPDNQHSPQQEQQAVDIRPEVQSRIASVDDMTFDEVQRLLMDCISELQMGKITAKESNALSRAANARTKALQQELLRGR